MFRDVGGVARASIPAGWIVDAAGGEHGDGAVSEGVSVDLVDFDGGPALRLEVDGGWLAAPARVFPVTVDPTVVTHYNDEPYPDQDTYYLQNSSANYRHSWHLKTGRNGSYK